MRQVGTNPERQVRDSTQEGRDFFVEAPEDAFCCFGRAQSKWLSENYQVETPVVADIISRLGVSPEVDCFATKENKRFDRWWGEGSPEAQDAFTQHWGEHSSG